jgi:hypothetical protein
MASGAPRVGLVTILEFQPESGVYALDTPRRGLSYIAGHNGAVFFRRSAGALARIFPVPTHPCGGLKAGTDLERARSIVGFT